jgi:hypothetical protein
MNHRRNVPKLILTAVSLIILILASQAFAADSIKGQVLGGGAAIAKSTVTLWSNGGDH